MRASGCVAAALGGLIPAILAGSAPAATGLGYMDLFTDAERADADAGLAKLKLDADALCTGCRYCMPCPEGVGISEIFRLANAARIYGLVDGAKHDYALFDIDWPYENYKNASHCTACGACLDKCPQKIDIPEELKKAHDILK